MIFGKILVFISDITIYYLMIGPFDMYGIEETAGVHIILSNILWWVSVVIILIAYRYRNIWNMGYTPWSFLVFSFVFFAVRELGHLGTSPLIGSLRYIFGIWSAIFMTSAFYFFYQVICIRKKISLASTYMPVALASIFPIFMFYLYFSVTDHGKIKDIISILESVMWIIGSSLIIYTTFMMGTHVSGGFVNIFMFFQFSAFSAFMWKFLRIIELFGGFVPYYIREGVEMTFGLFSIISVYLLLRMLRNLSRNIYGDQS